MATIQEAGAQLIITYQDESRTIAYPSTGGFWVFEEKGNDAPDPGPGPTPGPGGWHHPLGKKTPWTTYEDGGGSHSGGALDFGSGPGNQPPVYAACDGPILFAGWEDSYGGNVVVIGGPDGEGITYAHLNEIYVKAGDVVKGGTTVALAGWTGLVIPPGPAGAHLHLEVRRNGTQWGSWYPALSYFAGKGVDL